MSLLLALCLLTSPQDVAPGIAWEPFETRHASGGSLVGRLGRLTVPERHANPDGPTIELAFAHFPSTSEDPGPPIFYLAGGPGGSGIDNAWVYGTARPSDLLAYGDLIAIDQRGVGRSEPSLTSGPEFEYSLPLDQKVTRASALAAHSEAAAACLDHWREQGVDLAAYNTLESADDIEAVAAALGYNPIVLYGTSYGTHLGLTYLRRHPERVARAVLSRVEGPDHTYKLPSQVQAQLERFAADLAADERYSTLLPDALGTIEALLEQLEREDIRLSHTPESEDGMPGETVQLLLGPWDLRVMCSNHLGDTRAREALAPALLQMQRGDWSPLGETAHGERTGAMLPAMALMMDCSSGASAGRLRRLERERQDPANLLGDAINWTFPELCRACGSPNLGTEFRSNFECDVPTLFISGASDPRTPVANAEEVLAGFSHAAHFVASNVVHDSREWMSRDCSMAVWAFLEGELPESREFELPPFAYSDPLEAE